MAVEKYEIYKCERCGAAHESKIYEDEKGHQRPVNAHIGWGKACFSKRCGYLLGESRSSFDALLCPKCKGELNDMWHEYEDKKLNWLEGKDDGQDLV